MQGSPLEIIRRDHAIEIQPPDSLDEKSDRTQVILKRGGVKGAFTALGKEAFEFACAKQDPACLSLVQFRLPESAYIEEIRPEPVEKTNSISRQFLTVVAHVWDLEITNRND
jgi:hypothetical protein